ncbi:MAG: hypothetical protein EZS28_050477 [Streblomastix strix]|uniref:Uncharacterized protein n=1 Tax=Streblomastix strix TaxID=222440 RepID=A0A5J4T6D7_9EUKA|nr:MAG: hypothetical protein EZS28_050477 [Streblomastix strix]
MLKSESNNIIWDSNCITSQIIKVGLINLKVGQQHPFRQQLQSDGTVVELISVFNTCDDQYIHNDVAHYLSILFKAFKLPLEINKEIIKIFKDFPINFDELGFLAESPDNHVAILENNYVDFLLGNDKNAEQSINLIRILIECESEKDRSQIILIFKKRVRFISREKLIFQIVNKIIDDIKNPDKEEKEKLGREEMKKQLERDKEKEASDSSEMAYEYYKETQEEQLKQEKEIELERRKDVNI